MLGSSSEAEDAAQDSLVKAWRAHGGFQAWALQVLEIRDRVIVGLNAFLDTDRWFPMFELPRFLDVSDVE